MSQKYEVIIERRADKDLNKLPKNITLLIVSKIQLLEKNPRPTQAKKLQTNYDDWRLRIGAVGECAFEACPPKLCLGDAGGRKLTIRSRKFLKATTLNMLVKRRSLWEFADRSVNLQPKWYLPTAPNRRLSCSLRN